MIYLKGFKLSPFIDRNPNAYPDYLFKPLAGEVLWFDRITIFYGSNGSGKSTLLNIIANKLDIAGQESMKGSGKACYAEHFIQYCAPYFAEDEHSELRRQLPSHSQYIKSEDLLYEIKKIQQQQILKDSLIVDKVKQSTSERELKAYEHSYELHNQLQKLKFAQEKYSNGETAMLWFEQYLKPNALYLLDEPETSLSPQNQILLAQLINSLARYEYCQFIIATHSPFLLGNLDAKIFNLNSSSLSTAPWYELDHMKQYFRFFQKNEHLFK